MVNRSATSRSHLPGLCLGLAALSLIACGQSPGGSDDPPTPRPVAPSVAWLTPLTGADTLGAGVPFTVQTDVTDPDSPLGEVQITLSSDLEGVLLTGRPDTEGAFLGEIVLQAAGAHTLLARVTDPSGLEGEAGIRVTVRALSPPSVTLQPPGQSPQAGDTVTVTARCADGEDEPEALRLAWELDGRPVEGTQPTLSGSASLSIPDAEGGAHTVTVVVKDSDDLTASASVTFTVAECPDADRDGYDACPRDPEDCDDGARDVNPGEDERCDEIDHDCDGDPYNDLPDGDRDGVSDCLDPCPVDRQDDPDLDGICQSVDNCPREANPDQADGDGDGQGDACDLTPGEVCDGLDNDQDGQTDEGFDADGDGAPTCKRGPIPADCDDANAAIFPGNPEVCDGLDNNCNAIVDDGFEDVDMDGQAGCVDPCPGDPFDDADGDGLCAGDDNCPNAANPEQRDGDLDGLGDACDDETVELCDGVDNDLDGAVDEGLEGQDSDGDGALDCEDPCPFDPDNDAEGDGICGDRDVCPDVIDPLQEDVDGDGVGDACDVETCDGLDNDADGASDEGFDVDGDGVLSCGIALPDGGDLPGDCDDEDADIYPGAEERCDGVDHDCDGATDEGYADGDGDGAPDCRDLCPGDPDNDADEDGVCGDVDLCPEVADPDQADIDRDGVGDACDPENTEICDGVDNDGDGAVDEDASFQLDDDGDGILNCVDLCPSSEINDPDGDGICEVVDNCPGLYNPDQTDVDGSGVGDRCEPEICDGVDNDLDGILDEGFDGDGDGYVSCPSGGSPADCDDADPEAYPGPEEVCGDGADNDCDGLIDLVVDEFEPNDLPPDAHPLGLFDNNTIELYPTIGREGQEDRADFFEFTVIDDPGSGAETFLLWAELEDIPPGLELGLYLYYGSGVVALAESDTPGGGDQAVTHIGRIGIDDGLFPYLVEVRYLGGDVASACGPYTLRIHNEG